MWTRTDWKYFHGWNSETETIIMTKRLSQPEQSNNNVIKKYQYNRFSQQYQSDSCNKWRWHSLLTCRCSFPASPLQPPVSSSGRKRKVELEEGQPSSPTSTRISNKVKCFLRLILGLFVDSIAFVNSSCNCQVHGLTWVHSGLMVDSHESTVDSQWVHHESTVSPQWTHVHCGLMWVHHESTVSPPRVHCESTVDSREPVDLAITGRVKVPPSWLRHWNTRMGKVAQNPKEVEKTFKSLGC